MKKLWASPHLPLFITLCMLAILFTAASILYPPFRTGGAITDLIRGNAGLGIAAVGMTLVILSGGIDLSVGAVFGCTTVFVAVMIQNHHWPPIIAIGTSLLLAMLLGLSMGFLIDRFDLPPFLVTLGGMFFARGLGFVISTESVGITHPFYSRLAEIGIPVGGTGALSASAVAYILFFIVGIFVTHQTAFGRNVYALGGNEASARLMGVPVGRTKLAVYAWSGICAALAGVVSTIDMGSGDATLGSGFELDVIAAAVVGGTLLTGGVGSQIGTLAGVLIFGTIHSALDFDGRLNSWWLRIAIGGLLLVFILLQRLLSKLNKAN